MRDAIRRMMNSSQSVILSLRGQWTRNDQNKSEFE